MEKAEAKKILKQNKLNLQTAAGLEFLPVKTATIDVVFVSDEKRATIIGNLTPKSDCRSIVETDYLSTSFLVKVGYDYWCCNYLADALKIIEALRTINDYIEKK